jgi:hypothetical protein
MLQNVVRFPVETPADAIWRFRLLIQLRIPYQLYGCPLWRPALSPAVRTPGNCSIAAAWALGLSIQTSDRYVVSKNGGWLNSDGVIVDAKSPGGFLDDVPTPAPGDIGAFGWTSSGPGHVWMVTRVNPRSGHPDRVIDCSPNNGRTDSVREHAPGARLLSGEVVYARLRRFHRPATDPRGA